VSLAYTIEVSSTQVQQVLQGDFLAILIRRLIYATVSVADTEGAVLDVVAVRVVNRTAESARPAPFTLLIHHSEC